MKVIFLDIDGVLNGVKTWAHPEGWQQVHDEPINQLKRIMGAVPDVKIVISSSWRRAMEIDELRRFLGSYGVDSSRIVDYTPMRTMEGIGHRACEINEWLEANGPVDSFVVLDDSVFSLRGLMEHVVHTDSCIGLSKADADKAIELLQHS